VANVCCLFQLLLYEDSVSMSVVSPYAWLKAMPTALLHRDEIPLVSPQPSFPWQPLIETLTQRFELSHFNLEPQQWQWREPSQMLNGIAGTPFILAVGVGGYEGHITVIFEESSLNRIMAEFMQHEPLVEHAESSYQKGFMHFLAMETLDTLTQLAWQNTAELFLAPHVGLPTHPLLTLDVACQLNAYNFHVRVLLDDELRKGWLEQHRSSADAIGNAEMAQRIYLPVSVQAGQIALSASQWQRVQPGDFLILDKCDLDAALQNGTLTIRVHHLPFFMAQLNEGAVFLTEQAILDEVVPFMAKHHDDEDDDFDFDDDLDEEFNFEDDDLDVEMDTELDDDSEDEVEEDSEIEEPATADETHSEEDENTVVDEVPQKNTEDAETEDTQQAPIKKTTSLKDLPLNIAVEIGRFEMTIEKLLQMQPGNVLDLHIRPEDGVDLIANGRRLARGELMLLGESLGVRVTEI
jgi:flagellar motor switch protein FliN/FliY